MKFVAGMPDHDASMIQIGSLAGHVSRNHAWLSLSFLFFLTVALAGCVAQPRLQNDSAIPNGAEFMSETVRPAVGPHSDPGQSVESETDPHLEIENRPPFPIDPTAFTKPESDLPRSPSEAFDPIESVERDAWVRIREGLSLPLPMHPRVVREIEWYSKNKEYFRRTAQRARPYLAYIVRQVERKELPSEFALLPFVESAFLPYAYSSAVRRVFGSSFRRPEDSTA